MDQTTMVNDDLEVGRQAVEAFDELGPTAKCAFWFYRSESGEWRFVVATPVVDRDGPREAYAEIAKTLGQKDLLEKLPLTRVAAVGTRDPLVQLLRTVVRTGPKISGIRFQKNVINGVHIEDAYIYRMQ